MYTLLAILSFVVAFGIHLIASAFLGLVLALFTYFLLALGLLAMSMVFGVSLDVSFMLVWQLWTIGFLLFFYEKPLRRLYEKVRPPRYAVVDPDVDDLD